MGQGIYRDVASLRILISSNVAAVTPITLFPSSEITLEYNYPIRATREHVTKLQSVLKVGTCFEIGRQLYTNEVGQACGSADTPGLQARRGGNVSAFM